MGLLLLSVLPLFFSRKKQQSHLKQPRADERRPGDANGRRQRGRGHLLRRHGGGSGRRAGKLVERPPAGLDAERRQKPHQRDGTGGVAGAGEGGDKLVGDRRGGFFLEDFLECFGETLAHLAQGAQRGERRGRFSGLLLHQPVERIRELFQPEGARDVGAGVILRGLRAVSDFEYEYQMVGMNRQLDSSVETVFLMAEAQHQAIASKLVKEICRLDGDVSKFVTPAVEAALRRRLHRS